MTKIRKHRPAAKLKLSTDLQKGSRQRKRGVFKSNQSHHMLRRLSVGLLASNTSIASLPSIAQEGSNDFGVMSISLKKLISPPLDFKVHCKE